MILYLAVLVKSSFSYVEHLSSWRIYEQEFMELIFVICRIGKQIVLQVNLLESIMKIYTRTYIALPKIQLYLNICWYNSKYFFCKFDLKELDP